jgi:hypothetical protein
VQLAVLEKSELKRDHSTLGNSQVRKGGLPPLRVLLH